ncbi:MAG: hypothetical protein HY914_22195 [Desulfomonile tiedjei]|nr:hypothetical protein [Desulfomonile tiedjei]
MERNQETRLFDVIAHQLHCVHALTGLAPAAKLCARCYDCATCPYDQMLDDMAVIDPGLGAPLRVSAASH